MIAVFRGRPKRRRTTRRQHQDHTRRTSLKPNKYIGVHSYDPRLSPSRIPNVSDNHRRSSPRLFASGLFVPGERNNQEKSKNANLGTKATVTASVSLHGDEEGDGDSVKSFNLMIDQRFAANSQRCRDERSLPLWEKLARNQSKVSAAIGPFQALPSSFGTGGFWRPYAHSVLLNFS